MPSLLTASASACLLYLSPTLAHVSVSKSLAATLRSKDSNGTAMSHTCPWIMWGLFTAAISSLFIWQSTQGHCTSISKKSLAVSFGT